MLEQWLIWVIRNSACVLKFNVSNITSRSEILQKVFREISVNGKKNNLFVLPDFKYYFGVIIYILSIVI